MSSTPLSATMLISIFANLLITPIIMERVRLVCLYHIVALKLDNAVLDKSPLFKDMSNYPVSYTHLTLPTNREV